MNISAKKRKPGVLYAFLSGNKFNSLLIRQLMRVSGIVTIILLTTFQVLLATSGKGQDMAAEKVTIGLQHESLAAGLKKIEEQTPLRFFYRNADIKAFDNLNLPFAERTVQETLNELLQNTFFTFRQIDDKILLEKNTQTEYIINGRVIGIDHKALPFATVSLRQKNALKQLQTTMTDTNGNFRLTANNQGDYLVNISSMGMDSLSVGLTLGEIKIVQLPDIILVTTSKQLKEVQVSSTRPPIAFEMDKMIVNVDGTMLSKGNTVLDVLKKSPGVQVGLNNKITVNGKSVTILLDDRNTHLSASDVANLLSAMPSESVDQLEIMTNPSSKYDAAGSSIINIVTKKKKLDGYILTTTVAATQATYFQERISLNYLQKLNKLSLYSSFSFNHSPTEATDFSTRLVPNNNLTYLLNGKMHYINFNYFFRGGVDYQLSEKSTIGALITANAPHSTMDYMNLTAMDSVLNNIDNSVTKTFTKRNSTNLGYNLYYNWKIKKGKILTVNLDHGDFNADAAGSIFNTSEQSKTADTARTSTNTNIHINSVKVDYSFPVSKSLKVQTGVKSSIVSTGNATVFENLLNGTYINDTTKTNSFNYRENINAIYASATKTISKSLSAQLGFRVEQTNDRQQAFQQKDALNISYLNLFPTFYLNKKFNENSEVNFSYSRRLDRPSYQDLNPFIYYINSTTYFQGNPYLRPQYMDNYLLSYLYQHKYFFSFNYTLISQIINGGIPSINPVTNIETSSPQNFGNQSLYFLNLSFPVNPVKWWSITNYYNFNYTKIRADYQDGKLAVNKPQFYLHQDHIFNFDKTTPCEITFNYTSKSYFGFSANKGRFVTDLAFQRNFLKNNAATIKLAFNDLFKQGGTISSYNYQNLIGTYSYYGDSRSVQLSFTYNINKLKVKNIDSNRQGGSEEEQKRIKN